eukprot:TRINITY_DN281_c0_g1_i1.p1 TRINITY_DN281_c0_g1~~TRINITY_DN281_c0_g1_i1.p1  ORF type:complete len:834 (+),score=190.84 TRINITY_DN281_c0_g1_i1:33-2504(+)
MQTTVSHEREQMPRVAAQAAAASGILDDTAAAVGCVSDDDERVGGTAGAAAPCSASPTASIDGDTVGPSSEWTDEPTDSLGCVGTAREVASTASDHGAALSSITLSFDPSDRDRYLRESSELDALPKEFNKEEDYRRFVPLIRAEYTACLVSGWARRDRLRPDLILVRKGADLVVCKSERKPRATEAYWIEAAESEAASSGFAGFCTSQDEVEASYNLLCGVRISEFAEGQELHAWLLSRMSTAERQLEAVSKAAAAAFPAPTRAGKAKWDATARAVLDQKLSGLNREQQQVLRAVLTGRERYTLVQGPPGTGKTFAGIRLVQALRRMDARSRILCSAPSNAAVQTFALKCLDIPDIVLSGAESKLPADSPLRKIFVDRRFRLKELVLQFLDAAEMEKLWKLKQEGVQHRWQESVELARRGVEKEVEELCEWAKQLAPKETCGAKTKLDCLRTTSAQVRDEINQTWSKYRSIADAAVAARGIGEHFDGGGPAPVPVATACALLRKLRVSILPKFVQGKQAYVPYFSRPMYLTRLETSEVMRMKRVVFCTLCTAGRHHMMAESSFDLLVVDEATQSVEAETLIPMPLVKPLGRVVLVGDPKQLPATTIWQYAKEKEYHRSMYCRFEACGVEPIRLQMQYRMHPAICMFPSEQYYGGLLRSAAHMASDRSRPWHSTRPYLPCSFVSVRGKESEYANAAEAHAVVETVRGLRQRRALPSDIVVLTPYTKQVELLRTKRNLADVEVATVDSFQGSEKDIVIVSLVRTEAVGFLKDCERLNVALTRAKSTLIVIGHADFFELQGRTDVATFCRHCRVHDAVSDFDDSK